MVVKKSGLYEDPDAPKQGTQGTVPPASKPVPSGPPTPQSRPTPPRREYRHDKNAAFDVI
ncbi:MAG TPA: hypothetical protein VJK53_02345 [Candidatus Paceibacterota bacterium]